MSFDRIFFNTHTPVLMGKQVALVIAGPLGQVPNLLEIFRGFFEFQGANLVGVVSDEHGDSADLDRQIDTFPQAKLGIKMLNTFVAPLLNLPSIRKKFDKTLKEQMVWRHKQVVAKA